MRASIVAAGAVLSAWAPALAQDAVTNPDWAKRPSADDLLAVFPVAAQRKGVGGQATIACEVTVQGTLRACKVDTEKPEGMGFGAAALALTPQFLMKPMTKNGQPVAGGTVRIPIRWQEMGIAAGSRLANPPSGGRRVYSNLPWAKAPTYAEVAAAYPAKAREKQVTGASTLSCNVNAEGELRGCGVVQETPKGLGFGSAARSLSGKFKTPPEVAAQVAGGSTQIVFAFPAEMATGAPPVIGKPDWARLPSAEQVEASYPPGADRKAFAGRAVLSCEVVADGGLTDCRVAREDPAGLGLGKAALSLSGRFGVSLWTPEGLPTVGGRVSVPIRYTPEAGG